MSPKQRHRSHAVQVSGSLKELRKRLEGDAVERLPLDQLDAAKAELSDEILSSDVHSVNAEIVELILKHNQEVQETFRAISGVAVKFKPESGQIGFDPAKFARDEQERYDEVLENVAYRCKRVWQGHNRLPEALKDDVDEIVSDLERALERHRDKPWRLHDDFATAVVNLSGLDGAEQELRIQNLLRDLQDGVSDLRELMPELREKTKARMAARIGLPDDEVLDGFEGLIEALGDAGEADLVQELRDHLETLKTARAENPDDDGAPMEEGAVKDAAYAEGGLWIRVRNRANEVANSVGKGADGAVKTTEKTAKILDAAQKIGKHWQKVEPWIIGWF